MSRYKRRLTEEERSYIRDLSTRNPKLAMNTAKTLREQSYRIGGRTIFFTPPKDENKPDPEKKKIRIRKRGQFPKWPKCIGKIKGFGILE